MNVFQLVLKQMRQRALSTWLTMLSVLLGVGLATAILVFQREAPKLFGQHDYGYDTVIGVRGNKLQLVLNTVYGIGAGQGTIPYTYFEQLPRNLPAQYRGAVRWKVPYAFGDDYKGLTVVGTNPEAFLPLPPEALKNLDDLQNAIGAMADKPGDWKSLLADYQEILNQLAEAPKQIASFDSEAAASLNRAFEQRNNIKSLADLEAAAKSVDEVVSKYRRLGPLEYRPDRIFHFAEGHVFHPRKFEAVIGADVPLRTDLKIGSKFKVQHGGTHDEHDEQWTVVGILQKTYTANDRLIFIPLESFYCIAEHEKGMTEIGILNAPGGRPAPPVTQKAHEAHEEPYDMNPDGTFTLKTPKKDWRINAILVRTRGVAGLGLQWAVNNNLQENVMAANPAYEMRTFFDVFLSPSTKLFLAIAVLVTVVAAISILVSIYNSVSARLKEIAVLRALGATRVKVLTLICIEAGLIGLIGGVSGLVMGHLMGAGVSIYLERLMGEGIDWLAVGRFEGLYLWIVVVLAILAGFVPAIKAYKTPVATNLVSG